MSNELSWWQVRQDETANWDIPDLREAYRKQYGVDFPNITQVSARYLVCPRAAHHLCSAEPNALFYLLDYQVEYEGRDELPDDDRERFDVNIEELLMQNTEDHEWYGGTYAHWVLTTDTEAPKPGFFLAAHCMGAFEKDESDRPHTDGYYWAREFAQGNHHV